NTDLNTGHGTSRVPDFVKLAEAYGCVGLRCERDEDIDATIAQAMEINDRPVVVHFTVSADAMVWPMVPTGVSNDEIQLAQGMSPEWERDICACPRIRPTRTPAARPRPGRAPRTT